MFIGIMTLCTTQMWTVRYMANVLVSPDIQSWEDNGIRAHILVLEGHIVVVQSLVVPVNQIMEVGLIPMQHVGVDKAEYYPGTNGGPDNGLVYATWNTITVNRAEVDGGANVYGGAWGVPRRSLTGGYYVNAIYSGSRAISTSSYTGAIEMYLTTRGCNYVLYYPILSILLHSK